MQLYHPKTSATCIVVLDERHTGISLGAHFVQRPTLLERKGAHFLERQPLLERKGAHFPECQPLLERKGAHFQEIHKVVLLTMTAQLIRLNRLGVSVLGLVNLSCL